LLSVPASNELFNSVAPTILSTTQSLNSNTTPLVPTNQFFNSNTAPSVPINQLFNSYTAPIISTNESLNSNTAPEPSESDLPINGTGTSSFRGFVFAATNIRKETGNIYVCISYLKNSKPQNTLTMTARVFFSF
jgi:hypothetical protein